MDLAQLTADLQALRERTSGAAAAAPDTAALDQLEVEVLGKKGELTASLRGIGALPAEDRPKVGAIANQVRVAVEGAIADARARLGGSELAARLAAEAVDVTTPGRPIRRGSLHPIVETAREIAEVFAQFGFVVYEGPEIEDDRTNFQMLNIPPDHPARDLWDTLYLDTGRHLLRTHTSPGQIRVMHQERPPIRALLPGRCFRYEAVDASHAIGVLPGRWADGRRGHLDGATSRACSTSSPTRCSAPAARPDSAPATTRSPSPASPSTSCASSATARSARRARRRAG